MSYAASRALAALVVVGVLAAVWGDTADLRSVLLGLVGGVVVAWAVLANKHGPAVKP